MAFDPAAFDAMYAQHAARLYSISVRITGDRALAEDVVQETFVKAYTQPHDIVVGNLGAWLSTVARNASLNAIRNRGRTVGLSEEADEDEAAAPALVEDDPAADPAKAVASSDAVRTVWSLVEALRPETRAALVLRYGEEQPIEAVAAALGKTVNATTVLLHRGRAALRSAYAERVFARAGLPPACRSRRAAILAYLEDPAAADAEVVEHLQIDPFCAESLAELRSMSRAFAVAPFLALPGGLQGTIAAGLAAHGVASGVGVGTSVSASVGSAAHVAATGAATSAGASGASAAGTGILTGAIAKVAVAAAVIGAVGMGAILATSRPPDPSSMSSSPALIVGVFESAGTMTSPRASTTATLLADGTVLLAGGRDAAGAPLQTAEVYDPRVGTFTLTGDMTTPRSDQTATLLANGKVLLVGGLDATGAIIASAELYDPTTATLSRTGPMRSPRLYHTATLLPNGSVLVAGGTDTTDNFDAISSAEIYDPTTGTFSPTAAMAGPRLSHSATNLLDGRVLVAGGALKTSGGILASAELYDPKAGTFSETGPMQAPHGAQTATLLKDGKVLIAAGLDDQPEIYDPMTAAFALTSKLPSPHMYGTATLLLDGRVLIAGGWLTWGSATGSAELYDPTTGAFTPTAVLNVPRAEHTATRLADGRVLFVGGRASDPGALDTAELFR